MWILFAAGVALVSSGALLVVLGATSPQDGAEALGATGGAWIAGAGVACLAAIRRAPARRRRARAIQGTDFLLHRRLGDAVGIEWPGLQPSPQSG